MPVSFTPWTPAPRSATPADEGWAADGFAKMGDRVRTLADYIAANEDAWSSGGGGGGTTVTMTDADITAALGAI